MAWIKVDQADAFRNIDWETESRDANIKINLPEISMPDISFAMQLGRDDNFSLFTPYHRKMASKLIEVLMGMKTYEEFLSASAFIRDRVNPYMYVYAVSVAVLHRPETVNLRLPPMFEIIPEKYFDVSAFSKAMEQIYLFNAEKRMPIEISRDFTASDLEPEHWVAYFREDIGINLHHWHWHLVYPSGGERNIVAKDRRGEIFYYMHQQMLARYNSERLCNRLARVKPLYDYREPIPEAFFSKLNHTNAQFNWPSRTAGLVLKDVNRDVDKLKFNIQDLERWRDRIIAAAQTGRVVNENGDVVKLTEQEGIDILGNMVESSILSINPTFYGDLHNFTHMVISVCHDPDYRNLEKPSPIGDTATAVRDPVFFRLHALIDHLFQTYKSTLPWYTVDQLDFKGIRVTGLEVNVKGKKPNELSTYWQQRDMDLAHGMDFRDSAPIYVRITHLQYDHFSYKIQVENNTNADVTGTVRIFMAPILDEKRKPMPFVEQRHLFMELDKFTFDLKANPKVTTIERESTKSAITIPWEPTFEELEVNPPGTGECPSYCGCGWPEHMLIPRGFVGGFPCQLFVMITNSKEDLIDQPNFKYCSLDASSYCGLRDKKFPDKRSLGFPFDRMPQTGVDTLQKFLTPNMAVTDVTIFHQDLIVPPVVSKAPK